MEQRPDPAALRVDYTLGRLDDEVPDDPYLLFEGWYADAVAALDEPNAMVLSTVSEDGQPSSRTVLLKGMSADGLDFYTNYTSRKGVELAAEPRCALLFPWYGLQRQVRVKGVAERLSREESEAYFATRPRDAQLGAWASPQSSEVPDRAYLDRLLDEAAARFEGTEVPCPEHWGGYRVRPVVYEFWQGRKGRMHDRMRYLHDEGCWHRARLAP